LSTSPLSAAPRSSLSNAVDIVVAPNAAFDRLREVPSWGWAFAIAGVLGIAGSLLAMPATMHALQTTLPAQLAANDAIAKLPPEQQQKAIANALAVTKVVTQLAWLFVPVAVLIVALLQALVMTVANAIAHGEGSFKKFFALSITVAVVGIGLSSLVVGIIVLVRGADSFESATAVQSALPSLALLAPGAKGALAGFLGALNVFYLWSTALLALGMVRVARIAPPAAWSAAIVLLLLTACFAAWGGARNG
jgi:Yip1-like protein